MDGRMEQEGAPIAGANASAVGADANASQSSPAENQGATEQNQNAVGGEDLIPRSVMESQLEAQNRHWQSVIDKRFSQLESKFSVQQPAGSQPQPSAPAPQDDFDNDKFLSMLDEDPAKARQYFFAHNGPAAQPQDIQQAVQQAVQQVFTSQQQHEQQMAQFVHSMDAATSGLTEQEKVRAEQYAVSEYRENGSFVDPYMAAMVGRYGSIEAALKMANAQMIALGQSGRAASTDNSAQNQRPPITSGPGLVGGGVGQNPVNQGAGAQQEIKPGSFRKLLR